MKRLIVALSLMLAAASAACASVTAKAPPERPALEVPAPPAKVVEPSPKPEPAPEPVPDLPAAPPTNSPRSRRPARPAERPDTKPETPTTTEPIPPPAPVPPAPQLRPGGTPDASEAAKQAQIAIDRAGTALKSVNYRNFPKPRRAIYDGAVLMLKSAEDALKKSDFDNAKKLAEKVETTAKELGAR
jgi:outer membrane biosynthesis protein TonB